ncbi:MAG: class I SAM-dependent methyltransferase [Deltaproteobacteria bacterium]|nr:class I SAM-dependent methyltransferase [Deltaproteobacteria bacterium]
MPEWFENDSFWRELFPYLFPKERFDAAEEEMTKALSLLKFKGKSILDLCCGPGRHSIALAKRGFKVTGIDRTSFFLKKAKERARKEEDMRNFVRENAYDLVISMFTSFGYFDRQEEDLKVLQNIYRSLKPEGACLIDLMGKEIVAKIFHPTTSQKMPNGTILVERHEIFDNWTRIRNEWILINEERARSFKFHHTLYSGQELKDRLKQAGFQQVRLFGDLEGSEYGLEARRLVAVAWKEQPD